MFAIRSLRIVLIFLVGLSSAIAQISFQAAFWNVENLFDTANDVSTQDDDFTPAGRYAWSETQLLKKYYDLSTVIHDISRDGELALLGLAEIENRSVLERLNTDFIKSGYQIIHKESPDERGIDCALLYDPDILYLKRHQFIPVFLAGNEKTRDIIEAEFVFSQNSGAPSIYVFVNHWPSRWGGQSETEPLRLATALTLRTRIDEILMIDPGADIILMGDFNDYPDNRSLYEVLRARDLIPKLNPGDLINTTWRTHSDPYLGTCMFDGAWVTLDQIIISPGLMDKKGFTWQFGTTAPFRPDYLIEADGEYAGWPFRMHRRGEYNGGYSDHLPIRCQISVTDS
ncbi:MAG: endonuclease/exonuclease/phosphatase family protein [Candidatus Marinimicrobia bacterium]|nr:endonuclease/exonuclease/phosphatase family protein [Candidatus Neomarinimicrobiota bacterium]